ncbi:response regulator receiver domain-containing protein [Luteibacter sp. OK325]|uniref:response regulator n=1 Tax=Luteibacter sp. OK325 TaxID=2135670 RepID=UPI000D38E21C|nr:response regulator [Luteibacter sp. OK325]PTR34317.1 response regulator receiver domain-containing protein [Luteibacter sp. OK325]
MNDRNTFTSSSDIISDAAELADAVVSKDLTEARFLAALVVIEARESGQLRIMAAAASVMAALGTNEAAPLPELGVALLDLADELATLAASHAVAHPDIAWIKFSGRRSMATVPDHPRPARSPRVLIVEDDPTLTDTMVQALARSGMTVVGCARDARTANQMLRRQPTVVLVDYTLLDGQCDSFIDRVRATGLPVAMLTGFRPNELPTKYRQLPILSKPYGIDALTALVERLG